MKVPTKPDDTLIRGTFKVDCYDEEVEVAVLSDVPHLLKNSRNGLMKHKEWIVHPAHVRKYQLPTDKIKWEVIERAAKFIENKELKIAPHLKMEYFDLNNFSKMNVLPAKWVFSHETGTAIEFLVKNYPDLFPETDLTTAHFCKMYGKFYDLTTSRTPRFSFHKDHLEENIALIEEFCHYFKLLKVSPKQKDSYWKFQRATVLTCHSLIWLAKLMVEKIGYDFFLGGRVTNDSVENLHSVIRGYDPKPTPINYKRYLKAVIMTQFLKPVTNVNNMAYESDHEENSRFLIDFNDCKSVAKEVVEDFEEDEEYFNSIGFNPEDFTEENSLSYVGGYMLRKTIFYGKSQCDDCTERFIDKSGEKDQESNTLINMREYTDGCMISPSRSANLIFDIAEGVFRDKRESIKKKTGICNALTNLAFTSVQTQLPNIPVCHLKLILSRFLSSRLHFYASHCNKKKQKKQAKIIESEAFGAKPHAADVLIAKRT